MGKRVEDDVSFCGGGRGRRRVERRGSRGAGHQLHGLRDDVVQSRLSLPEPRPVILKHLAVGGRAALALCVTAQGMRPASRISSKTVLAVELSVDSRVEEGHGPGAAAFEGRLAHHRPGHAVVVCAHAVCVPSHLISGVNGEARHVASCGSGSVLP
jgi:hypothetical protein